MSLDSLLFDVDISTYNTKYLRFQYIFACFNSVLSVIYILDVIKIIIDIRLTVCYNKYSNLERSLIWITVKNDRRKGGTEKTNT